MSNTYNAKLELVFTCDPNLDLGEEYVENYYAKISSIAKPVKSLYRSILSYRKTIKPQ